MSNNENEFEFEGKVYVAEHNDDYHGDCLDCAFESILNSCMYVIKKYPCVSDKRLDGMDAIFKEKV